jgi:hypothetical protein
MRKRYFSTELQHRKLYISIRYNLLLFVIFYIKGDIMVQAIVDIGEQEDRVLTIVKGKYGFKNKSDAMNFVISRFENELLEPALRPEFIEKIRNIEKKGKFTSYKSLSELRKDIENA